MGTENTTETLDIRDYLRPVWSRLPLIVLVVLTATAATYLHQARKPKVYQTSTDVFVAQSELDQVLVGTHSNKSGTSPGTLARLLTTEAVANKAARKLRYKGNPGDLLGRISVNPGEKDSEFLNIGATAGNPQDAAKIADAFAQAFVEIRSKNRRQEARVARIAAENELATLTLTEGSQRSVDAKELEDTIKELRAVEAFSGRGRTGPVQIDQAPVPAAPVKPKPRQAATFAFVISLMLAIAAAFALERLDRRIRRPEDVETLYSAPTLAELPSVANPAPVEDGTAVLPHEFREPLRTLSTNLDLAALDRPLRKILITSAAPGEGKSTLVRNLAIAYREVGARVAVVDTDLRSPSIDKVLPVGREPGLTTVLTGTDTLVKSLQAPPVEVQGIEMLEKLHSAGSVNGSNGNGHHEVGRLAVLASGARAANPPAVLGTDRMLALLEELGSDFDVVLIDSSPLLAFSDAVPLISAVDGVILVSRLGDTTADAATRTAERIKRIPQANVVGVVVNGLSRRAAESRAYAYHYGS
jgi:polysaccharide biosynthesis transport protein